MSGNKSAPLVSVIINCYNGDKYLNEAIDSVFTQTYTNWEIIFWDNCSIDKSAEIAKSYGEKVKYHLSPNNTTLGEARNKAIQVCNGEYITFIDCDDVWFPNKLTIQVDLMEKNSEYILCYAGIEEIKINGDHFRDVLPFHNSGELFDDLLLQYDINILTSMIRRNLLKNTGLNFDPLITASEEYCLFMQLASTYQIGVINSILAKYRVHIYSLTNKSFEFLGRERRYTLEKILINNPKLKEFHKSAFKEAFSRSHYYDANYYMLSKNRTKAIKSLFPIFYTDYKYFILFLLTFLPYTTWAWVQKKFRNRE